MMHYWQRAIILVDMNAFFASIEQLDHPEWRARAVVVTNGKHGSCIITCSYEARAYGIKTGMHLAQARQLAPDLVHAPSRPERYVTVSCAIMSALQKITPDVEVFSIDEAFLDVTACQRLHGGALACAHLVKKTVFAVSGLHCSIGLSSDKTTAKYAANLQKPNGLQVIAPEQVRLQLATVPITDLCGIAKGTASFLARFNAYTCGDVAALPMNVLARRFGNRGRRLWLMCQGQDPEPVRATSPMIKSMSHSKILPPNTNSNSAISNCLLNLCDRLAARLRKNNLWAQSFTVGYRQQDEWMNLRYRLLQTTQDHLQIYTPAAEFLNTKKNKEAVSQLQIKALDPQQGMQQQDLLFENKLIEPHLKRKNILQAQDDIQQRFGTSALKPARLVNDGKKTSVISPAWRPDGARQTIAADKKK